MSDYRVPIGQPTFDAIFNARTTGILAAIRYRVEDNDGNVVIAASAMDAELGTSGVYRKAITTPGTEGEFTIIYSKDGTFDPTTNAVDYLVTYDPGTAAPDVPPLIPISGDGADSVGPCQAWTTAELAAACCGIDSMDDLDGPVVAASQVLFELSNRQYAGTCERRVRPCGSTCGGPWQNWQGWGWLPMNRGGAFADFGVYGAWPSGANGLASVGCGCTPLDRIPLAGSAREILEVTIDGEIVAADSYRLDERRWLTRTDGLAWPACQDMTQPETEDGTFSILYTYGQDPPSAGILAAQELACAIHQTCPGGAATDADDCPLPSGVTKIERIGITIDLDAFKDWGWQPGRGWATGLFLTDMFLNTYAPQGRQGRTRVWSPDTRRFPRPIAGAS